MSSKRKHLANRLNAQKSTGPRTPEGKARSSMNARKHGFFAREVLLPQENADEFTDFVREMRQDLKPVGALEEVLASQVVAGAWRMKRLAHIESGVFAEFLSKAEREWARIGTGYQAPNGRALPDVPEVVPWGRAFTYFNDSSDILERLTRYQNLVTREFYRPLRELQRLQTARPPIDWDDDSADILPLVQNEPIPATAVASPPPGSGGGRGVGPVENSRDRQPATVAVQNDPIAPKPPIT
ncbi:MAG: hypothetical protein ACYC7E_01465, partial [Armatimonadota bacterium]